MAIRTGTKTVTTAGTRVQLSSTWAQCKEVVITAYQANTGVMAIGDSNVVAASGSERGATINAAQTEYLHDVNLSSIYIDSTVNGEGVSWVAASEM